MSPLGGFSLVFLIPGREQTPFSTPLFPFQWLPCDVGLCPGSEYDNSQAAMGHQLWPAGHPSGLTGGGRWTQEKCAADYSVLPAKMTLLQGGQTLSTKGANLRPWQLSERSPVRTARHRHALHLSRSTLLPSLPVTRDITGQVPPRDHQLICSLWDAPPRRTYALAGLICGSLDSFLPSLFTVYCLPTEQPSLGEGHATAWAESRSDAGSLGSRAACPSPLKKPS